jgi:hypothetical protein
MARQKDVTGQGWSALLATATKVKNEMYHRTLKASPNEALKWDEPTRQAFRKRVIQSNAIQGGAYERAALLEQGSKVRVRLVKGALSKQSDPSFSDQIFTISDVIKSRNPQVADAYRLEGKDPIFKYARTDLLPLTAEPEQPPERPLKRKTRQEADLEIIDDGQFTRSKRKEVEERIEKRQTRNLAKEAAFVEATTVRPKVRKEAPKPAGLKVGPKVFVQYPDKRYSGVIQRLGANSVNVFFPSERQYTTLQRPQFNLVSVR